MLSTSSDFPSVVSGFYEAAARPGGWSAAWDATRAAFKAETGLLYRAAAGAPRAGAAAQQLEVLAANRWSAQAPGLYRERFVHLDPFVAFGAKAPGHGSFLGQDAIAPSALADSDFYREFAVPHGGGAFHTVCATIELECGATAGMGLHRPIGAQPFEQADREALHDVARHVASALRLQGQLSTERLASAARGAALDQLCHGAVIVTADGTVVFANAVAEDMADEGAITLGGRGGALCCADKREAARLAKLIGNAARGGPGGTTRISRDASRPIVAVNVAPLSMSLAAELLDRDGEPELALVTLRDLAATSDAGPAELMELFGLTGAEAAIVPQLLSGDSVSIIAQGRGASVATVRAQVSRVLDKTKATNLRALATMIAALGCG